MTSSSKKKEKVTVEKRKGIKLLFRKKSIRDFHKTHPSGSGVLDVTEEESTESKSKSWGRDEDDKNNNHDSSSEGNNQESDNADNNTQSDNEKMFVKTPSNYSNDEDETNVESKIEDKAEVDEDKEMDYTTDQFDNDVDVRLNEPVNTDEGFIQKEGTDAEMINVQQGNENLDITLNQVVEDAYVTISTIAKETKVPVTSSSHSSNLASKFLKFSDIPPTDAEIISPMDVPIHHEVPSNQTPTLLTVPVLVITESSLIYTTVIPQSLLSFTPPPPQSTPTPPPTNEATNPLSGLPNFVSIFQFNNKVSALEKDVAELKKDHLLNTQVTALVDEHLDSRIGATRDEFMSYLSASITARIIEQVKIQLPQILAKDSFQLKSTYEAASSLIEFELKKFLIDKMDESQSYLTVVEHRECYDRLIKSYDLDKSLFSTYDKVYSLKRIQKDKDKDEDPSVGSDRGLKKRKNSKVAEPTKGLKTKDSQSGSSKGTKSQSKSSRKSVHTEELEFEVANSDMPQDQEENLGNDDYEPKRKVVSKCDWFAKPKQPEEPTDPDWNVSNTL
ncbi:hypothetical protein Tco_0703443 [Tanacetum coccineum]|uniref:Ubinuclein middle domain-containing protein n=1 Tax=Tanacetum coccineum TaxID=301880 RepID=A0ABQ4Y0Q9_9ASTR